MDEKDASIMDLGSGGVPSTKDWSRPDAVLGLPTLVGLDMARARVKTRAVGLAGGSGGVLDCGAGSSEGFG